MNFTKIQQEYLKYKKSFYHNSDNSQNLKSLLELKDLQEINNLIEVFLINIQTLMNNNIIQFGYCGKEFFINYKSDNNKNLSFKESFIDKDSLKKIITSVGSYLPILMFYNENEECLTAIECVHTKYSLRVIKECFEQNLLSTEQFLFIVKPIEQENKTKITFILPKILYDKIAFKLQLEYKVIDNKWVQIFSDDVNDLWLLFKLFHKEASYYIAKYMSELFQNNYIPSSLITKK